jgi:hypothetical protein
VLLSWASADAGVNAASSSAAAANNFLSNRVMVVPFLFSPAFSGAGSNVGACRATGRGQTDRVHGELFRPVHLNDA